MRAKSGPNKITLIGLPGSGKTHFGKIWSEFLNINFYDLDHLIEKDTGQIISEIFNDLGEDYFRKIETKILLKFFCEHQGEFILAAGGGTPCFNKNFEIINSHSKSVFLNTPIDKITKFVNNKSERPLLNTENTLKNELEKLYQKRIEYYQQAHFVLNYPYARESILEIDSGSSG